MCCGNSLCICVVMAIVILFIAITITKKLFYHSETEISDKLLVCCLSFIVKMTIIIVTAHLVNKIIDRICPKTVCTEIITKEVKANGKDSCIVCNKKEFNLHNTMLPHNLNMWTDTVHIMIDYRCQPADYPICIKIWNRLY